MFPLKPAVPSFLSAGICCFCSNVFPSLLKEGDGGWDSSSHGCIVGQCFCKTSHVPPEWDTPGAPHTWDFWSLPLACLDLTNSFTTKNSFVELEESNSLQTLPVQCPDVPEQRTAHSWGPLARTTPHVGKADTAAAHTWAMGHTRTLGLHQGTAPVGAL